MTAPVRARAVNRGAPGTKGSSQAPPTGTRSIELILEKARGFVAITVTLRGVGAAGRPLGSICPAGAGQGGEVEGDKRRHRGARLADRQAAQRRSRCFLPGTGGRRCRPTGRRVACHRRDRSRNPADPAVAARPGMRRVIVKARIARHATSDLGAARPHQSYILRDGVTRDGQPGQLYDKDRDDADGSGFLARQKGDRYGLRPGRARSRGQLGAR